MTTRSICVQSRREARELDGNGITGAAPRAVGGGGIVTSVDERVRGAADWRSYYAVYRELYREVLEVGGGLGRVSFANQLHSTTVPDASGSVAGSLNWAAYSQPSAETLRVGIGLLGETIGLEPRRERNNRYLFFVPNEPGLDRTAVALGLGNSGPHMDFWSGSLSKWIGDPAAVAALRSVDLMFAESTDWTLEPVPAPPSQAHGWLQQYVEPARRIGRDAWRSVAPLSLRSWLATSSVLLAAFRLGIAPEASAAMVGGDSGVAALIAQRRAEESNWGEAATEFFTALGQVSPLQGTRYLVRPGDMLSRIVREHYEMSFHLLWPVLRSLNPNLTDPNLILAGETILLPELPTA
jgi:hypothetical protein